MYYVLDSEFEKVFVDKGIVGSLKRLGYRVYSIRYI